MWRRSDSVSQPSPSWSMSWNASLSCWVMAAGEDGQSRGDLRCAWRLGVGLASAWRLMRGLAPNSRVFEFEGQHHVDDHHDDDGKQPLRMARLRRRLPRPRAPLRPPLQRPHRPQVHKQPLSHLQLEGLLHFLRQARPHHLPPQRSVSPALPRPS